MKAIQCNIYIHDLDVKQEARVRRLMLMSGALHATRVRFIQDLDIADVWILQKDSAFLNYAKKRLEQSTNFSLWLFDGEQVWLASIGDSDLSIISRDDIAQFIDRHISIDKPIKKTDKTHIAKSIIPHIAKQIHEGMKAQEGTLCIELHPAIFYFDFNNLQVKYNNAAYEMLWLNKSGSFSMSHMTILPAFEDKQTLTKSCSAFLAIWQMTHKLQDEKLANLLTANTSLQLETWPPFEQVKHQLDDYRIASLLQKKSLSAKQVSELLDIDRNAVNMFFNAVYLSASGKLVTLGAGSIPKNVVNKPNTLLSLWKRVRTAVGAN